MIAMWVSMVFADVPCVTMQRWGDWQSKDLVVPQVKSTRTHNDVFDTPLEQVAFSEHFALHWGESFTDLVRVEDILDLLETSLAIAVNDVGMPSLDPTRYFNVYLADTGGSMPESLSVAGYYDLDYIGQPMVILGEFVTNSWSIAKTTIPHELFHALQHRSQQYGQFEDRWYWEATATWMEQVVLPGHPSHADFLHGYALLPHLPLTYYSLFSGGGLDELHPYGAFIVFKYLTEYHAIDLDIGKSWTQRHQSIPVLWWNSHLESLGTDLGMAVSEMSAHNLYWEYENQLIYQTQVQAQVDLNADNDQRIVGKLSLVDEGNEITIVSSRRPGGLGYNVWTVDSNEQTELRLVFDGVTIGDHFGHVDWKIAVVRMMDDVASKTYYETIDGMVEIELLNLDPNEEVSVTVTASSLDFHEDERFVYSWHLEPMNEPKVSACSQVSVWQPLWMLLVLGWVPSWRRQRKLVYQARSPAHRLLL